MKSAKVLFLFFLVRMSVLTANAQVPGEVTLTNFFQTKYTRDQVWDVQRSPAYPKAGQEWTLSGLKNPLDASGSAIDWGKGRYLLFVLDVKPLLGFNQLVDDVNNSGKKYAVTLKLFESNGTLVKVVSKWGKFIGLGAQGCMYEAEGRYGTFFSTVALSTSTTIKYKPTVAGVTKLSELSKGVIRPDESPKATAQSLFFNVKYTKNQVWDAQRSPAYPVAEKDWTLSGLKGALDAGGASIQWGTGRYLMFTPEADPKNGQIALADDVSKNGTKQNISLKLYESNGTLVKVVSKWGKLIGMGAQGFMYEEEGRYGVFFSATDLIANAKIVYKPAIRAVTKLSELSNISTQSKPAESTKSNIATRPAETPGNNSLIKLVELPNGSQISQKTSLPQNNGTLDFFQTKFYKNQVWEVTGVPEELNQDEMLSLTVKGPALIGGQEVNKFVDWGKNGDRYLMFYQNIGNSFIQMTDDIKNDTSTLISARLYERNGTVADGEIFRCGLIMGLGTSGVVYGIREPEQQFNLFFSANPLKQNDVVTYKPILAKVTRLSQLQKGKIVTQQDRLKMAFAEKGGISNVQFNPKATYGTMTDQSGNTYKTIKIGNQTWMAENLRTTRYRNGDPIPIVNLPEEWNRNLMTGACCSYKNTTDKNRIASYGLLYNWLTLDDPRNIAPAGWHVPSEAEWTTLITFLGGEELAGTKMKETGTTHWLSPNTGATNESGFSAVAGGEREYENGNFNSFGFSACYWSSVKSKARSARSYYLSNEEAGCTRHQNTESTGLSVRLVKD